MSVSNYKAEFEKRDVKVMALSVDGLKSHEGWIQDINETQNTTVNFPIIADEDKKVSNLYGMIHPKANDTLTVRSVFVIAPDKSIKMTLTYPASTGRNFDELLRVTVESDFEALNIGINAEKKSIEVLSRLIVDEKKMDVRMIFNHLLVAIFPRKS